MWNGWVDNESQQTYIIGHWNYEAGTRKPVYVVSTADEVELFLNGKSLGKGTRSYHYLHTFEQVDFEPGTLLAVGSDGSRYQLETAGAPTQLKLTAIENPEGTKADGADMVLSRILRERRPTVPTWYFSRWRYSTHRAAAVRSTTA